MILFCTAAQNNIDCTLYFQQLTTSPFEWCPSIRFQNTAQISEHCLINMMASKPGKIEVSVPTQGTFTRKKKKTILPSVFANAAVKNLTPVQLFLA